MVRTAGLVVVVLFSLCLALPMPLQAQRVRFPSQVSTNSTAAAPSPGTSTSAQPGAWYSTAQSPSGSPIYGTQAPAVSAPPVSGVTPTYPPGRSVYGSAPGQAAPAGAVPVYPPGAAPPYAPGSSPPVGPGYVPGPTAQFQGNIQLPPAWDPYATPGSQSPSLMTQDPYMPWPPVEGFGGYVQQARRFLHQIRMDYVWMPGDAKDEMGINDVELNATFAFPFLGNIETPLLVTPGFAVHYWDGPPGPPPGWVPPAPLPPGHNAFHMPPRVYDAYLDAAWNPRVNEMFGGELSFRVGVYSDFGRVTNESLRYQGTGLAVFSLSPSYQIKAGAMYLDRERYKIFPAGGVVWTPNPDVRFEILFPNPRLAMRLSTVGNTDWWGYVRGEYGGGSWTMKDIAFSPSEVFQRDYNDIRVGVGAEFERLKGLRGLFEVGGAFDREIFGETTAGSAKLLDLNPTVYVRGGLAY